MFKHKTSIRDALINKVNELIDTEYPNEELGKLRTSMENPNEVSDLSVTARYVNEELYRMYLDFESIIHGDKDNMNYLSSFARNLQKENNKSFFKKLFSKFL